MKTDEIRALYLDFFRRKGHTVVASDSLIPQDDPTLLFTGAGMNQFKEYFLGVKKDLKRASSSQKCLRTGDLEEVGKTAYHHSFFEMLGNFSFGDYFKEEAISWAWEFLTEAVKLPKERLRISVHQSDKEAYDFWLTKIRIRKDWIYPLGDDSNFWPANAPKDGPNGPCGPCSEIYFDQDPTNPSEDIASKRFAEIWNLVFTQFDRQNGGALVPLKNKNIDTGMGLERLACVLQGKSTNYEIDIFQPINARIAQCLGVRQNPENEKRLYAVSDHARAVVFSLADGVIPANDGRGYVVRKLIRRALWHAHQIVPDQKLTDSFLYRVVPSIVSVMKSQYPELSEAEASIVSMLRGEEDRFLTTLDTGLRILETRLKSIKGKVIPGETVFELYDTYGFPDELTRVIAGSQGFEIDQTSFNRLMDEQRKRAKDSTQIANSIFVSSALSEAVQKNPITRFLGYDALESESRVLWTDIKNSQGILMLDQSPFYGESGGQVGDQGTLESSTGTAQVIDAQKQDGRTLHYIKILKGDFKVGDAVKCRVDQVFRDRTMRNHTATHLLHAALRKFLGKQVRQLGSLVSPEKLRFDYSYPESLSAEQIQQLEDDVNRQILSDTALTKEEKNIEDAKRDGALAFFGEKYGDKVRVVTVPGYSKEFCGGTHCERTGQIGSFVIISDSSIGSGIRRIEAYTGEGALEYLRTLRNQIQRLSTQLKTAPKDLETRVQKLADNLKKFEKGQTEIRPGDVDLTKIESQIIRTDSQIGFLLSRHPDMPIANLRNLSDLIKNRFQKIIFILFAESDDKIQSIAGVSPDLSKQGIDIRPLMTRVSSLLELSGGGRGDMFQGGGPNHKQLESQWQALEQAVREFVRQTAPKSSSAKS